MLAQQTVDQRGICLSGDLQRKSFSPVKEVLGKAKSMQARGAAGMKGSQRRGERSEQGQHAKVKAVLTELCASALSTPGSATRYTGIVNISLGSSTASRASLFGQGRSLNTCKVGSYFRPFKNHSPCKSLGKCSLFYQKVMKNFTISRIYYPWVDRTLLTYYRINGCVSLMLCSCLEMQEVPQKSAETHA